MNDHNTRQIKMQIFLVDFKNKISYVIFNRRNLKMSEYKKAIENVLNWGGEYEEVVFPQIFSYLNAINKGDFTNAELFRKAVIQYNTLNNTKWTKEIQVKKEQINNFIVEFEKTYNP